MLTQEDVDKIRAQHKRIAHVVGKNKDWEAVFRSPKRSEWKRFRSLAHNAQTKPEAQENIARACVVYPSPEAFDALLEDFPGIPEGAADAIGELAGIAVDEASKA